MRRRTAPRASLCFLELSNHLHQLINPVSAGVSRENRASPMVGQ